MARANSLVRIEESGQIGLQFSMPHKSKEQRADRLAYEQVWRAKNNSKVNGYAFKHREVSPEKWMLTQAKKRAKQKGLAFNLTLEDIQIPEYCPALGIKLFPSLEVKGYNSPSLDRVDNSKGYIKGNVQVISWRANNLRRDATNEEIQKLALFLNRSIT